MQAGPRGAEQSPPVVRVPSALEQESRSYRPDIDGLRAIAVLAVIVFHIDKALLPGGFVGVNIFFVISGYLISLHIFRDLARRVFSLVEFYRRRVKRIAPAMLVVVAVTLLATQQLFRPEDAEATAASGLWSLLSLANVYFWSHQDTSYFAAASSEKPLLHLWSLGVEEQFYIVWPLILMLVYRRTSARSFFVGAALIAAGSFGLGELLYDRDPSFVYYMLPTRAGELLVGALAAHIVMRRGAQTIDQRIIAAAGIVGLMLVGSACFRLSEEDVFPGWLAVPPTVGTALLILAGNYGSAWPTRLLSMRPMVGVGLISYSAYLWHWPLLAIYRYGRGQVGAGAGLAIFALTMLLAWLSYRYVELPARLSKRPALHIFVRQYVLPAGALACLTLLAMNLDGYGLRWLSPNYASALAAVRDHMRPAYAYDYVCQRQHIESDDVRDPHCVLGADNDDAPIAILWGDSNAAHYVGMLAAFARDAGFRFRNVEVGDCPPITTDPAAFVAARRLADCRAAQPLVQPLVERFPVIMLSASWTAYEAFSDRFLDAFFDSTRALAQAGKRVVIIGKAPMFPGYDRLCWEKALSFPHMQCRAPDLPLAANIARANARLETFAASTPGVEYFDVNRYLCPAHQCSAFDAAGNPIYYDAGHLTLDASWALGRRILAADGVPAPIALVATTRR